ncbi:MAG: hypothetical protein INH41_29070 [Myxococcaceae bacterium]|jgi:hypothetical protein|nr:hypothetical protein [Myxococcaceae bacterium]
MATKAEQFRAAQERSGEKKPKQVKKVKHLDPAHTDTRNVTLRGDKGPSMALEDSMSGRPSRKSTRPSAHGGRNDTALMRTARAKSQTPKARALRAKAARKK